MKFVYLLLLLGLVTIFFSFINSLSKSKAEMYKIIGRVFAFLAVNKQEVTIVGVLVIICLLGIGFLLSSMYPLF